MPGIDEYAKELMMVVLVASTAFTALTGVVIGQVMASGTKTKREKRKQLLVKSCALGIAVVLVVIIWFLYFPTRLVAIIAALLFLIQMLLFWLPTRIVWSEE